MRIYIKKWFPVFACIAAVLASLVYLVLTRDSREEARLIGPFRPYLRQYTLAGRPGVTTLPDPVRAVVLVCDNLDEAADSAFRFGVEELKALPEDMRAGTPEEVNTVIRINKVYIRVRRPGRADATALRAYVTVVNLETDTYWVQNRMVYTPPPEKENVRGKKKAVVEVGMEEIIAFLRDSAG